MAIQAQHHPSNVLLLNNRNVQSEKNPPGILHQSHMIFSNGVEINSRKRNREEIGQMNSFPFHNQNQPSSSSSQFIDLSQVHNSRQNVSTGLRLTFDEQKQRQQQYSLSNILSDEFISSQIHHQSQEIHHFLQSQNEQLRQILEEKRNRHYKYLLAAAEETVRKQLIEKEIETEKAVRRNIELEGMAARLIGEAQNWQIRAKGHESTVKSLKIQLQQVLSEDGESSYVVGPPERADDVGRTRCKACGERLSAVVCLPCRHFCMCKECDSVAEVCPVCFSLRNSGIEVCFI